MSVRSVGPLACSAVRRRIDRRRGMALFVALVIFLILAVVVYSLTQRAILETRIARNQGGFMKFSLALRSMIAYGIALIQEDLARDVEENSGATSTTGAAGVSDPLGTAKGTSSKDAKADVKKGVDKVGEAPAQAAATQSFYDSINESLFQTRRQQVNDISIKIEIRDGESRINLNKLYEYVNLWQNAKDEDEIKKLEELEAEREKGLGSSTEKSATKTAKTASEKKAEEDQDRLQEILGPEAEVPGEEAVEEWIEPDASQREAARRLLADLVIHMVETNLHENGFEYETLYDADTIGAAIEQYVFERKGGSVQNYIFTTAELLQIPEITPELFNGPLPPELADPAYLPVEGQAGFRRDEFGDVTFDYGLEALGAARDRMGPATTGYGFNIEELAAIRNEFGIEGNYNPGMLSLSSPPFADNEDGTGIVRSPEPIGLKHLLCTFSNGKVNLNTAPMEVFMALLQGGGDPNAWNADVKLEVGRAFVAWRDGYTEEYLTELEEKEKTGYAEEEEELLNQVGSYPSAEDLKTNVYRSLADLQKIGDGELLKTTSVDSGKSEREPGWLVRKDLEKIAAFSSEFFTVRVVAKEKDFRQESEFVVHRDTKQKLVSVLYYRERQD